MSLVFNSSHLDYFKILFDHQIKSENSASDIQLEVGQDLMFNLFTKYFMFMCDKAEDNHKYFRTFVNFIEEYMLDPHV